MAHPPGEVIFRAGDLVQVYRSDLDFTFKMDRKLLPKFSAPQRVVARKQNSYQIETLEGFPIAGWFSSRRLCRFMARQGTELERAQVAIEGEWRRREEEEDKVETTKEELDPGSTAAEEGQVVDAAENQMETGGMSQTPRTAPVETSSNGSQEPCNEAVA